MGIQRLTQAYFSDFYADILIPSDSEGAPAVLVWHGRGPNERQMLRPLAAQLADAGAVVIVPDFSPLSADYGRAALLASIDWALERFESFDADLRRLCLLGWSFGARAAVGYVLEQSAPAFGRVIGLAGSYTSRPPTSGAPPLDLADQQSSARFLLVHGRGDSINSVGESEDLHRKMVRAGTDSDFLPVDTDHAGVILTRFDEGLGICVSEPSPTASSLRILDAVSAFAF